MDLHKLKIYRSQPYHRKVVMDGLISRGADYALIYLWYNLIEGNYNNWPSIQVAEQITNAIGLYPEWEADIVEWFKSYEVTLKTKNA